MVSAAAQFFIQSKQKEIKIIIAFKVTPAYSNKGPFKMYDLVGVGF